MADTNNQYHTHISSKHKLFSLNLKEVWRYKDLIVLFTKRSFTLTYKQTVLGPAWIFLNPLISSLIHAFIFGGVAGFSNDLGENATTFTANAGVFGKVYFPRLTTPISNALSSAIRFLVQMLLVGGFMVYFLITVDSYNPNWLMWLMVPVEMLHLGMLGMGLGIIISSMTTKYRDLTVLVTFGVQLWMYITPIVYPLNTLGEGTFRTVMMLNPVTAPTEIMRNAFLGTEILSGTWTYLGISWAITVAVMFFGIMIFNKVEKTFMDTV